jgi:hypothetical protein
LVTAEVDTDRGGILDVRHTYDKLGEVSRVEKITR